MTKKQLAQKSIGLYFNVLAYINPKKLQKDGFKLFCNPFARSVKPHQQEFLNTGLSVVLNAENHNIQTYKWGSGNKHVLLLHGWASHSFRWKAYIEAMIKNDYTIYALDAPGHGMSSGKMLNLILYAKVIKAFLAENNQVKNIVTHSMSGFALNYMVSDLDVTGIEKVVMMGAPGEASDFFDFYKKTISLSNKATNLIIAEFKNQFKKPPTYFSNSAFAKNMQMPALIVHDKQDEATDYRNSVKLHENWKNSKLVLTEGLGHDLKGKSLIADVIAFLNE